MTVNVIYIHSRGIGRVATIVTKEGLQTLDCRVSIPLRGIGRVTYAQDEMEKNGLVVSIPLRGIGRVTNRRSSLL